jgi:hypothetical protein
LYFHIGYFIFDKFSTKCVDFPASSLKFNAVGTIIDMLYTKSI